MTDQSKMKKVGKQSLVTGKKGFDWAWQKYGILGNWMNKQAGKVGIEAVWPTDMPRELDKSARILWTFTQRDSLSQLETNHYDPAHAKKRQRVPMRIPPEIIERAEGLAIFTVFRSGLGISAASGSGVVIARDSPTTWGAPSGILIHTIGVGWLAGVDVYDTVLVLRTRKAVEAFTKPKISLGAELAIAAGPVGSGAQLQMGVELAPVLAYTKSKGLYGGLQLDGNIIIERSDENARFYGRKLKAREILAGGIPVPGAASGLVNVIQAAEGKPFDVDELPEQVDVAPSETVAGADSPESADARSDASTPEPVTPPDVEMQPMGPTPLDALLLEKSAPPPPPPRRSLPPPPPPRSAQRQRMSVPADSYTTIPL